MYIIKTNSCKKLIVLALVLSVNCGGVSNAPVSVKFKFNTIKRVGNRGCNWCTTWAKNCDQITSMDDGSWLGPISAFDDKSGLSKGEYHYYNHLYRIIGDSVNFTREDIPGYPRFLKEGKGWFGYGICSVNGVIYSLISKSPSDRWHGPFAGIKMLKSTDNGHKWYRVNQKGRERLLEPGDDAREEVNREEMFFFEEFGIIRHGKKAYPFSFCSFVQNGQDNNAARDEYVYIYSPEGARSNHLCLARVKNNTIEKRDIWEYFSGWKGNKPKWSRDIRKRSAVHVFPEKNQHGEYFGWYSWLPSVVWNPGLNLYIMVNGGTYAGDSLSNSSEDYYNSWMHTKTGSLGFWYSEKPYGPWKQFYYTDYWTADDEKNLTYQPKLSPKWISEDGRKMILIWSDAMKDEKGRSHSVNYLWNQMEIEILTK
ncbi:DUF4185 domain-containing protein [candidate division KSB1 bacterium]|nr:DUF4185 domain-containing protein [candidate division KSB1 bacterium]